MGVDRRAQRREKREGENGTEGERKSIFLLLLLQYLSVDLVYKLTKDYANFYFENYIHS